MGSQVLASSSPHPIAVIGIGCRFPGGANSPEAFWRLLLDGVDTVGEIPEDRWDVDAYYHPDPSQPGKMYSRCGSFLQEVDLFDADFFRISPREAAFIDPQQRLLLEVAWEALEDGGQVPQRLAGTRVGVFVGLCTTDYEMLRRRDVSSIDSYSGTGGASSIAANRISYAFDFHGPSMAIDTACSSSLVAVHLACESLLRGESSLAVAGGANLMFDPSVNISFCKANMLSPRGQCSSFDARADGFVRAEGVGIVVLKPLSEALADGDPVYVVIRATAVNQDGRTNGISLPNGQAQEDLLREVYARADIPLSAVRYVEAHGTGTLAGDPIECDALGKALGTGRPDGDRLRIGSVKSSIGHAEGASGIAGLIKAALALHRRYLPASLHFQTPNPRIPFEALGLEVQRTGEPWLSTGGPAIAGVNSFGFGGTSAHAVLEEFVPPRRTSPVPPSSGTSLLPVSARSPEALRAYARAYLEFLDEEESLQDLCYTASVRREHHPHRLALVGRTRAELCESLEAFLAGERRPGLSVSERPAGQAPKLAFVFSGNGPQWWAMGRELLTEEPTFQQIVTTCDTLLREHAGWSLLDELRADEASTRMARTDIAQPALFALQLGLVALWRSWGIEPDAVVGHSVGEVAAAYVAGVLSLEAAIQVIFHRSRTQQRTAGTGGMAAVGLPAAAAREALAAYGQGLCVAGVNSPESVTVSGDSEALEQLLASLEEHSVFCRRLPLDYAFHSQHMEPIRQDLLESLEGLQTHLASVRFFSTVAGCELAGPELDAAYWWDNIRQPVEFSSAIQALIRDGSTTFLEIGPHPVLSSYMAECLKDTQQQGWALPSLRRKEDERATLLGSLGSLYTLGHVPDWAALHPAGGRCVNLPSYPWQRERHWQELGPSDLRLGHRQVHPLLGYRLESAQTTFQAQLDTGLLPYLEDHRVQGVPVFPAAGYLEMALAATDLHGTGPWAVEELEIHKPLLFGDTGAPTIQVSLSPEDSVFRVHARVGDGEQGWVLHATGQARKLPRRSDPLSLDLERIRARCTREIPKALFYQLADRLGIQYGPSFQSIERTWAGQDEGLGEIHVPDTPDAKSAEYVFHPIALDACFQTLLAKADQRTYLPVGMERLRVHRRPGKRLWCHMRVGKRGPNYAKVDFTIADQDQEVVAEIVGLRVQAIDLGQNARATVPHDQLYEERWLLKPRRASSRRQSARDLPSPSSLADRERVLPHYDELSAELGRTRYYQEIRPQMEALCAAYVTSALRQLGWEPQPGERVTVPALIERLGIRAEHERLVRWFLAMLEQDGVLRRVGEAFGVQRVPDSVDPASLWSDLAVRCSAHHADLMLLARCGTQLAQVLAGQIDPLEILFGDRSSATIEHLYESGAVARISNALTEAVVSSIVDRLPDDRYLRILELGAGTGGTTTHVLPRLPADRTEYVFTDVSEMFLQNAELRYRKYPFVRYQLLDIERDPATQGFEEHSFDLVIATNVLHATRDLRWTLNNVQRLLASGGLLALGEITNPPRVVFVIFGLLRGFWLFLDEDLRPSQALLPPDRWINLLEEVGFTEAAVLTERQTMPDQSILLARGPHVGQSEDPAGSPDPRPARSWLLLADQAGAAEQAGRLLVTRGDRVLFVEAGDSDGYRRCADDRFRIHPSSPGDMAQLFATLRDEQVAITDVVHCWSLDAAVDGLTTHTLMAAQKAGCASAVHLTQQLVERFSGHAPRLWLVTGGAQALHPGQDAVSIAQSPLVGLRRVIFNEHPELRCTLVDIGPPNGDGGEPCYRARDIEELCAELCCDDQEDEVLLRGQARYVGRLARASLDGAPQPRGRASGEPGAYRLQILTPGVLDSLRLRPVPRQRPHPGEVEIEVHATGLNFKDLMQAMGLLPAESLTAGYAGRLSLGGECAGRIVAVGGGVTDFQVGDEVIAVGRDALSAFITTDTALVVPKPPALSFEEGATLLVTFLTAHYALHHVAGLRRGERVLIHSATGGVGLAAIQIVRAAGGEVFATAGSSEKREYLRLLGVQHVMDSRSLTFAEEIMEITGGSGVHVVLNSLTGEGLRKSLSVLTRFGRFLELGKRDFLGNSRLGLRPFERCLSLHAIDVDQLMLENPALVRSLLRDVMARVRDGSYHPLPRRTFPVSRAVEAFRHMQQSRHIGKVVVSMRERNAPVDTPTPDGPVALNPDGTYLISGGLGGFGLATARWMIERGARHLVLAGRRGAVSSEAQQAVTALRETGSQVHVAQVDVSQEAQVRELIATIRASAPPLRGVVHAAMVLEDRLVTQLNEELLEKVMAPKVLGAWNLHEQTLSEPLDFFVLFSSMTSVLGNPGQGNYVAANAFLDNFAAFRLAHGLPALTINWGAIADVGYVAQHAEQGERLLRRGVRAVSSDLALETMGRLLQERRVRGMVAGIDWQQVRAAWPVASPRWADLLSTAGEGGPSGEQPEGFWERVIAVSADERARLVTARLSEHLALVLGASVARIDPERPTADVGLDSLMAMEFRTRIEKDFGIDIPVMQLMQARSLANLTSFLVERLTGANRRESPPETLAAPVLSAASHGEVAP